MANTYLLGQINAARILVENFPMSLLDYFKGREYDSIIDFLLDVLAAIPVNMDEVIGKIIQKVFKTPTADVNVEDIYKLLYYTDIQDPEWLVEMESIIGAAIAEALVGLLTCSAIPEIPDRYMDAIKYKRYGSYKKVKIDYDNSKVGFYKEKVVDEKVIKEIEDDKQDVYLIKTGYTKESEIDVETDFKTTYTVNNFKGKENISDYDIKIKEGDKIVVYKVTKSTDKSEYFYAKCKFYPKDKKEVIKNDYWYNKTSPATYGFLSLPESTLDFFGKLKVSPATPYGACLYDFGNLSFTYSAKRKYSTYGIGIPEILLKKFGPDMEKIFGQITQQTFSFNGKTYNGVTYYLSNNVKVEEKNTNKKAKTNKEGTEEGATEESTTQETEESATQKETLTTKAKNPNEFNWDSFKKSIEQQVEAVVSGYNAECLIKYNEELKKYNEQIEECCKGKKQEECNKCKDEIHKPELEEITDYKLNYYIFQEGTTQTGFTTYDEALEFAGYIKDKSLAKTIDESYGKKSTFTSLIGPCYPYSPDEMYKMKDLDAVIWYALNRGSTGSTYEMNKMIWDNRRRAKKTPTTKGTTNYGVRETDDQWDNWLKSKDTSYHYIYAYDNIGETGTTGTDAYNFYQNGDDEVVNWCEKGIRKRTNTDDKQKETDYVNGNVNKSFKQRKQTLYPIMQLFRDPNFPADHRLCVSLSAQRYYNGAPAEQKNPSTFLGIMTPNHTLYKFNWEYMRSIKIFSTKSILAQFIDAILGGSIFNVGTNFNTQFLDQELSKVLKKSIMTDDTTVNNCFFSFSNDEYNDMLNNMELLRYKAKGVYGDDTKAIQIDEASIMATINSINSSASPAGKISTIQRSVNQLTKTDGSDASVTTDGEVIMTPGMQILYNILFALIKPFYASLFSPKIILLFLINFHIAGIVDINNIKSWDDVLDILHSKMQAILLTLVSIIKDKIYEIILEIILEYIKPLMEAFIAQITLEFMEKWLRQLSEYTKCIPMFNFSKYQLKSQIDDVNYADIVEPEETEPETTNKC